MSLLTRTDMHQLVAVAWWVVSSMWNLLMENCASCSQKMSLEFNVSVAAVGRRKKKKILTSQEDFKRVK